MKTVWRDLGIDVGNDNEIYLSGIYDSAKEYQTTNAKEVKMPSRPYICRRKKRVTQTAKSKKK